MKIVRGIGWKKRHEWQRSDGWYFYLGRSGHGHSWEPERRRRDGPEMIRPTGQETYLFSGDHPTKKDWKRFYKLTILDDGTLDWRETP